MIKAIVLDCGGVMISPATGDWLLGPSYEEVLGSNFASDHLDAFRDVRAKYMHLLPDNNAIATDEQEYALFVQYFGVVFDEMGIALTKEQLERMAVIQTYRDSRYDLFPDVIPYLSAWRTKYQLGIVSDAPPSTRRILHNMGVLAYIDAATFSYELGVMKPDARIYRATLDRLQVEPEEALFVDDYPSRLRGAQAIGMPCVQMRRVMPPLFAMPPHWEGDIVHSFAELDAYIQTLPMLIREKV